MVGAETLGTLASESRWRAAGGDPAAEPSCRAHGFELSLRVQ